jgi:hypothetical protein
MSFGKCHMSCLAVACGNSTLKVGFSAFHGLLTFSHGLRLVWGAYRTSLHLLARAPRSSGKWVSSEYRPGAHLSQYEIILLLCRGQYTTSTVVLLRRRTRRGGSGGNGHRRGSRSKLCTCWSELFALAGRWGWERRGVEEQGHECHCLLRLALSLETNKRTPPLFDDELIVLVSLVSFLGKVWRHCRPKISTAVLHFAG